MSAFINISLVSAETATRVVSKFCQLFKICLIGASIITGKEDQRVVIYSCFFESGKEFSHVSIRLHNKVSIWIHLTCIFVRRYGYNRCMGSG